MIETDSSKIIIYVQGDPTGQQLCFVDSYLGSYTMLPRSQACQFCSRFAAALAKLGATNQG